MLQVSDQEFRRVKARNRHRLSTHPRPDILHYRGQFGLQTFSVGSLVKWYGEENKVYHGRLIEISSSILLVTRTGASLLLALEACECWV